MTSPVTPGEMKFTEEDLPRIHAALHTARAAKSVAKVTIDIAENGGVIAIHLETKKKFK